MGARLTQAYSPEFWQAFNADAEQVASALKERPEDTELRGLTWLVDTLIQAIARQATNTSKTFALLHRLERHWRSPQVAEKLG